MTSPVATACVVRRKQPEDDGFIFDLGQEAFSEYSTAAGATTLAMTRHRGALTWIAESNGQPVGFAILQLLDAQPKNVDALGGRHIARLNAIAVRGPERGRGIGSKLLKKAVGVARARGVVEIQLSTSEANLGALDLFTKYGFSITKRLQGNYERGQALHWMTKLL